jgi:NAD(P)-dependent dehydrogenase (short-subunit alcohol dehydrogenase family)
LLQAQRLASDARRAGIRSAVVWLCSDAASFVIGMAFVVDGGQTV